MEIRVYSENVNVIDTKENRDAMVDYLLNNNISNNDIKDDYRKVLEKKSLDELLAIDPDFVDCDAKVYYIGIIIAVYGKSANFGDAIKASKDSDYDTAFGFLLDNFGLDDIFLASKGYSNETHCIEKFEDNLKETYPDKVKDNVNEFYIKADFEVRSYHNYNANALMQRFINRVAYHWKDASIDSLYVDDMNTKPYSVHLTIKVKGSSPYTGKLAEEMLKFRFGSTSGRPWDACHIMNIEVLENVD